MSRERLSGRHNPHVLTLVLGLVSFFGFCALLGVAEIFAEKRAFFAPARAAVDAEDDEIKKEDEKFSNGASLKTDPELERLLRRAEQFAADGRYDLATVLWQKVLEESGDILRTTNGQVYTSMAAEVERTLAKLPAEGLKVYRITADGEAHAIMASINQGVDEEEALSKIVRRYFMSSLGDDAAYKLGCLALDRHDFVGASRMFSAILDQHPDPSMPRADILLRQAVASARVGDTVVATLALKALDDDDGVRPPRETIASVKQYVGKADQTTIASASSQNWLMPYGNPSRTGHMKQLPKAAAEADLAELWLQEFDVLLPGASNQVAMGNRRGAVVFGGAGPAMMIRGGRINNGVPSMQQDTRQSLVDTWKNKGWFPTGQLLFDSDEKGSRVYIKTATDLTCWDASGMSDEPVWRTAWANLYQPDGGTSMMIQMQMNYGANIAIDGPKSLGEILHFGDRVHQSMSMSGDLIFNLEGRRVPKYSNAPIEQDAPQQQIGFNQGAVARRTRRNWLAAYESRTGKARWYRSADDAADKEAGPQKVATDIGFLASPTPYGNLLLIPVTDGGAVWLYAIARQDGKTVWKSFLCDEPQGGCNQWSPVGVAVEGREAYVCCGTGAVFAVDAVSGIIRWAARYQRHGKPSARLQNVYGMQNAMLDLDGWQDDVVIPFGKLLVVLASDHNEVFALDRRTGEMAWTSPRRDAMYALGMVGRHLFVAGREMVRKYDVPSGKLLSERVINEAPRQPDALAFGRGCVTDDAVYLPVKDSVLKLATKDLTDISQVGVSTVSGDRVGNLFSDGEKLWVAGAAKVYALTNFDRRMAELAKRIEAGDSSAQLIRMRMQFTLGRLPEAIADLEGAYKLALTKDRLDASRLMVESLKEMQLATSQPTTTLRLLGEVFIDGEGRAIDLAAGNNEAQMVAELHNRKSELLYTTLATVRTKKIKDAVAPVLKLAPVMQQEYLLHTARKTLTTVATSEDVGTLTAALASTNPAIVTVAADALARAQGDAAKESFTKLLASDHEKIRLAGASGVLNLGDKAALPILVALLESADERTAIQANVMLRQASGKIVAFSPSDANLKKSGVAAWKEWLEKESAEAKLAFPLPEGHPMLGRTLICYYAQSKVEELDENNKSVWSAQIQGVWGGQGLPNGHRLLALYAQRKVVELDDKGTEVWSVENLPGSPFNVRRLDNGNTLVACSDSQRVVEYNRDKKEAWSVTLEGRPMDAVKLDNGNLLVAHAQSNRVTEYSVNDKGEAKVIWSAEGLVGAMTVERLENGNTLVACMNGGASGTGMVVEIDPQKNHVWKMDGLRNPYDAQRLPNGNTLITDQQRVQEVDANKKVIWQQQQNGSSSAHRF
jgi:outer membrane protein assembly factor BamB